MKIIRNYAVFHPDVEKYFEVFLKDNFIGYVYKNQLALLPFKCFKL